MYTLKCTANHDTYWLIEKSTPVFGVADPDLPYAWMTMGIMTLNERDHAKLTKEEAERWHKYYSTSHFLKSYKVEIVELG